jgi:hypothetical protein
MSPLCFRTAWNDYFTGSSTNLPSQKYTSRQTPSDTNVYVLNCLFGSMTSTGNGGALYCSSSVTFLLIESTSFFSCKTNGQNGGAIFFQNTNSGQCVLYEVCGNDCCSNPYYQFAYIYTNNGISSKNYANYSSIARCVNANLDSWLTFYLCNGKVFCPSINVSLNRCYGQEFQFYPFTDSNSVTCSITYSSFADNFATAHTCFLLNSCNVLRNSQGALNSNGIFYINANIEFEDSCILENNANYVFYQASSSYTTTLSRCTVDTASSNQNIITKNTVTKSFILALDHMSTQNCHSRYDSVGTLTPSKKQLLCFTYGNFFYQYQLRYLVSLISVFLFNFIHLNDSNDLL